jgi:hypothetical protein
LHDLPGLAEHGTGVADLVVLVGGEVVKVVFEAPDEVADLADLGSAGRGLRFSPVVEVGSG